MSTPETPLRHAHERRIVLRSGGSIALCSVVCAIVLFLIGDAVVRNDAQVALRALPYAALVALTAYAVLGRPCLIVTTRALTVVNVWRSHRVPFCAVDTVSSRYQLRIRLINGREVTSWGAPAASREKSTPHASLTTQQIVARAREQWEDSPASAAGDVCDMTQRIAWKLIGVWLAVLLICLADFAASH